MQIEPTSLAGVSLIRPAVHGDARGFFLETWHAARYAEAGIDLPFVQDNHSRSAQGILRGLHLQTEKPQGKLVRVTSGAVFDVVVDCRADSPTCGQWHGVILTAESQEQLWVPPGCAHGFLDDDALGRFSLQMHRLLSPTERTHTGVGRPHGRGRVAVGPRQRPQALGQRSQRSSMVRPTALLRIELRTPWPTLCNTGWSNCPREMGKAMQRFLKATVAQSLI